MADVTITPADVAIVTSTAREQGGTGGATLTAGQFVYLDGNKYKGAVNSNATVSVVRGVLLSPTADNQRASFCNTDGAEIDLGATLTEGAWYCISSTAGNIHPEADLASGEYISWVGYGNSDGNLMLHIVNDGLQHS